jgi:hypothetical protein
VKQGRFLLLKNSLFHAILFIMTITQTVDIPASRRVFLDLPLELPLGRARVTVTPEAEPAAVNRYAAVENLRGLAKRMGSTLTVERFLEMGHEEIEREEAEYRRMSHKEG